MRISLRGEFQASDGGSCNDIPLVWNREYENPLIV